MQISKHIHLSTSGRGSLSYEDLLGGAETLSKENKIPEADKFKVTEQAWSILSGGIAAADNIFIPWADFMERSMPIARREALSSTIPHWDGTVTLEVSRGLGGGGSGSGPGENLRYKSYSQSETTDSFHERDSSMALNDLNTSNISNGGDGLDLLNPPFPNTDTTDTTEREGIIEGTGSPDGGGMPPPPPRSPHPNNPTGSITPTRTPYHISRVATPTSTRSNKTSFSNFSRSGSGSGSGSPIPRAVSPTTGDDPNEAVVLTPQQIFRAYW